MELLDTRTDIGLIRDNNEDASTAIYHPKSKNLKFFIVSDGMVCKEHGEFSYNFVVVKLKNWFIEKDVKTLNDVKKTRDLLIKYIKRLNTEIIKKCGNNKSGTTLTMAILGKRKTIIANVGDSRAYIYKNQDLSQITEDDSDVWYYHKYADIEKEDLRFFSNNNIINACIGLCDDLCRVSISILDNDYDMLLLLTDGVTDLIKDKKIKKIIKNNNKEKVLEKIIHEAVYVDQHLNIPTRLKKKYLANYIVPFKGRDNATGAIYIKDV